MQITISGLGMLLAAGVVPTPHVAPALALEMQPILPTALAVKAASITGTKWRQQF